MSLCYDFQKWTILSLAGIAISLNVGLVLQYAHGQTTTVDTTDFSIDVPDTWTYEEGGLFSKVALTPSEFGILLVNDDQPWIEQMNQSGAVATFGKEWDFGIKNAGLDLFVKYKIDKQTLMKITSKQNVTIDNEQAVKIYGDGIGPSNRTNGNETTPMITIQIGGNESSSFIGIKFVEYMVMHNRALLHRIYG